MELNVLEVANHDPSGLSPDMMQELAYKLIMLGDCVPQTEPGSRCLVDIVARERPLIGKV